MHLLKEYNAESLGKDTIYWNALCQVFNQPYIPNQKKGRVLALACGKLTEWEVLSEFFDTKMVYAIDNNPNSIKRAKENNPHIPDEQIVIWDARNLQTSFSHKFDVITLRHPNPTEDLKVWKKILTSALESLEDNGVFVISTFTLMELQIILRMCLAQSVKIPFVADNKFPHPLVPSFDSYMAVIQKGHRVKNFISRYCAIMWSKRLPLGAFDKAMKKLSS